MLMRKLMTVGGALLLLSGITTGCGSSSGGTSSKNYKTITCGAFDKLANADDALTNGALNIAMDYLNASAVDPKGGADDAADFGDQISAACDTATPDTKIITLKSKIVRVFLAKHPGDKP